MTYPVCPYERCTTLVNHGHGNETWYRARPDLDPTRVNEQPIPTGDTSDKSCQQAALDRMNSEMPARIELGIARYGQPLMPFNGRNFMRDAFDELLDLHNYLEGVAMEREAMINLLNRVRRMPNEGNPYLIEIAQDAYTLLKGMGEENG